MKPARTLSRTKREVLTPGNYSAIPDDLLGDPDIPAAAKLVFAALVGHLRGPSRRVWPSADRIASLTATTERTVRRSIATLAEAGYIEIESRRGKTSSISFPVPVDGGNQDLGQNVRTRKDPGQNVRPDKKTKTPDKLSKTPDTMSDEALKEPRKETPPKGGDLASPSQNLKTTRSAISEAYKSARGSNMPTAWRDRIAREYATGDREVLGTIDAEVLIAASEDIGKRGLGFHLANVVEYLHRKQAIAATAAATRKRLGDAVRRQHDQQTQEIADREVAKQEDLDRVERFRALTPADRKKWTAAAMKKWSLIRRADLVERFAATMFEDSRQEVLEITVEA